MKTVIKKILLPTDFSKNAQHAHAFAVELSKKTDAEIMLFHAFESTIALSDQMAVEKDSDKTIIARDMRKVAQDNLVSLVGTSNKETGIHHTMLTYEGNVHDEILKVINNEKIDLVIMGTKGKTSDEGVFLGSITKGLLTEASCPILAIPHQADLKDIFRKIVFATDLKEDDTLAINYLNGLAQLLDAEVVVLHIVEKSKRDDQEVSDLQETISNYSKESSVQYKGLKSNDIASGINEFIKEQNADILAMTTHRLNFLEEIFHESLSKKMMLHSQIPFLSFNRKKNCTIFIG